MSYEKIYTPFYTAFLTLCAQKGVSPSVAARDAGISSGAPTAWKKGAVPKPAQRQKLCSYFGVTDDVLLGYVKVDEYGTRHTSVQIPFASGAIIDEDGTTSLESAKKAPTPEGEHKIELTPAFFRLKQGLDPYDISEADADFLVEVYKAHIKKNQ